MKNIITEVVITENGQDTSYAALCPANETVHQFLHWLVQELIKMSRSQHILRIPNTTLTINRQNVTGMMLTLSF